MDELKIKSKLITGLVSRVVSGTIKKKLGYTVDLTINEILVTISDDVAHMHIDADGNVGIDEFKKFTKVVGLE